MGCCDFRIGMGFDVHRLVDDRDLWLCGIKFDYPKGLLGHSDADVAIHALCDALLGAAAMRDIGYHFPDTDQQYKDADSSMLLKRVCEMLRKNGWEPSNVDITICAERPKLMPFIDDMRKSLANTMQIETADVSVKATTTEGLGFTGRKEGISAYAIAMISHINK